MGLIRRKVLLRWMVTLVCGLLLTLLPIALPGAAQSQTLVMGTEADYIPFAYHQPMDGDSDTIVGFDIDVARSIADSLGVTLQIQEMPFDQLLPSLKSGDLDFAN